MGLEVLFFWLVGLFEGYGWGERLGQGQGGNGLAIFFFFFFFGGLLVFVGVVGDADFGAWIRSILLLVLRSK